MTEDQVAVVTSPNMSQPITSLICHSYPWKRLLSLFSEIEFDVSKMDCNSHVPSELLRNASEQLQVNPSQVQAVDQSAESNQPPGLELVQYIDLLNFMALAAQIQIEHET